MFSSNRLHILLCATMLVEDVHPQSLRKVVQDEAEVPGYS